MLKYQNPFRFQSPFVSPFQLGPMTADADYAWNWYCQFLPHSGSSPSVFRWDSERKRRCSSRRRERWPNQENTERVRAGVTGHNVRYVLIFGLIAVIIAFAIVYLVYFHR